MTIFHVKQHAKCAVISCSRSDAAHKLGSQMLLFFIHITHIPWVLSSLQGLQRLRARLLGIPIVLRVVPAHLPLLRPSHTKRPRNFSAFPDAHAEQAPVSITPRQHFARQVLKPILLESDSVTSIGAAARAVPAHVNQQNAHAAAPSARTSPAVCRCRSRCRSSSTGLQQGDASDTLVRINLAGVGEGTSYERGSEG